MPVPSETSPGRERLPLIDLAAARALFRTAESSGLGRPGTDELFDEWLDSFCDIAFYRNGDQPLQARAVDIRDEVPEWLSNSRIGKARLEALYLNPGRSSPSPSREPAPVSTEVEAAEDAIQADETDTATCCCMPGLCWCCEADKEGYAKVDNLGEWEGGDDDCFLELVDAFPGGMAQDPSYDLGGELPPDFDRRSLRGLAVLTEVAQRKLDTERWDTAGPWRLWWSSCVCDVTAPLIETPDADSAGNDADGESGEISYCVSVENDGDAHTVQVFGTCWGDQRVMYRGPVSEPSGVFEDTGSLEGLRSVLERATEQVRETGYEVAGEWTVNWSRCYVLLDLEHY
ncbi:hypothetical protein [Streptomyces glomeratus]|uniref:Aromatic ring-opening dioxygenase LigA n=1 Tax=Streptomyces glomeratus TaxID=284452 RepID=A0ABP6LRA1_9ACTN|nr:hypothetical protein [Streptomyces glomeratus]MCF1510496.1 hypothetical protein [Streptomyces glomeratus]